MTFELMKLLDAYTSDKLIFIFSDFLYNMGLFSLKSEHVEISTLRILPYISETIRRMN